ncbi:holo-(acyl carrier protein) synthase 2 [Corynebacterium kalinowskii]|uniref:Holo-(Acyl carrier protein) synthase 2 n=1 Tax=Corynebacterium kalinowskii TaxID=2675216 RepID=A0A6B8VIK1_9CORY|nr:4'-phosphopantetheinyl transferase superfamily protein [Corynebacterium kalinowskii]QGU01374.1 holo-(acyl carrier protein) synthase 2 [Corynebacterium kalinowskii]
MAELTDFWESFRVKFKGAPEHVQTYVIYFEDLDSSLDTANLDYHKARGLSRSITIRILAGILGRDPNGLTLPGVPPYDVGGCRFSLSRTTQAMALIVSTEGHRVGADIEQIQTLEQAEQLIKVFHPADQARLVSARLRRPKVRAITQAWTHKEALLKGLEVGLVRDPALDEVGPVKRPLTPKGWSLVRIRLPKKRGHVASVAWEN